jgi:hypothetical protein
MDAVASAGYHLKSGRAPIRQLQEGNPPTARPAGKPWRAVYFYNSFPLPYRKRTSPDEVAMSITMIEIREIPLRLAELLALAHLHQVKKNNQKVKIFIS